MCVVSNCNENIMKVASIVYSNVLHIHVFDFYGRMNAQTSEKENTNLAILICNDKGIQTRSYQFFYGSGWQGRLQGEGIP